MDIKNILPFLMAGNKNADKMMPFIKMMSENGKTAESGSSAATNGDFQNKNDILGSILKDKTNPLAAEALQSVLKNNRASKPRFSGITPVLGVVNDDILGKMIKFLNSQHKNSV